MESSDIMLTIFFVSLFILFGFVVYALLNDKGTGIAYDTALIRIKVFEENPEIAAGVEDLANFLNNHWVIDRIDKLNDGSLLYILTRADCHK